MTILEEDIGALQWMFINHTAEDRVKLIEAISALWCLKCGRQYVSEERRHCQCENDE